MANRYWVGGNGTWTSNGTTVWSATSGGPGGASVPTTSDAVFFDQSGPYTVTVSSGLAAQCGGFTISAANVTFNLQTANLQSRGSTFYVDSSTVFTLSTGTFDLQHTSMAADSYLYTNGVTLNFNVSLGGFGNNPGIWNLTSSLTVTGILTLNAGTLNSNDFNITAGSFRIQNNTYAAIRTLNMGSANFYITSGGIACTSEHAMTKTTGGNFVITNGVGSSINYLWAAASGNNPGLIFTYTGTLLGTTSIYNYLTTTPSYWDNIDFGTVTATINTSTTYLSGTSIALSPNLNLTTNEAGILKRGTGTFITNGCVVGKVALSFTSSSDLTLSDDLTISSTSTVGFLHEQGTLNLNGFNLTTPKYDLTATTTFTRTLNWNNGNIYIVGNNSAPMSGVLNGLTVVNTGTFYAPVNATVQTFAGTSENSSLVFTGTGASGARASGRFKNLNFGTLTITDPMSATAVSIYGDLVISPNTSSVTTATINFLGTNSTINTNGVALNTNTLIIGNASTAPNASLTLNSAVTIAATGTVSFPIGTLNLNNFTLSCGIFSSGGTAIRSIAFGTGSINITHTTAATTVVNMPDLTNFTCTGTGGFVAIPSVTRLYTVGSTGGSALNGPNLTFGAGTSVQSFTAGSKFDKLDYGTSTFTGGGNINIRSLVLSTTGTYTSLIITATGTGTINTNGKTISRFDVNTVNSADICTLQSAVTATSSIGCTLTQGTLNLNNFNLTVAIFISDNTNTRSIVFGTGNINTTTSTSALVNVSMATLTNFSTTGTGGFVAAPSISRTYSIGNTAGGTATNGPNLTFTTGSGLQTITSGSWLNKLTHGSYSGSTPSARTYNLRSINCGNISMVNVTLNMVGNGEITALTNAGTVNINTPGVTTTWTAAGGAFCTTLNISNGTMDLNGAVLSVTGITTYTGGTITNTGAVGGLTSGTFNLNNPAGLSYPINNVGTGNTISNFNHNQGTLTITKASTFSTACVYTLNGGSIVLNNFNLTIGRFISSNTTVRSIEFGSGKINLEIVGSNTAIDMANMTNFTCTYTSTGGFAPNSTSARTFTVGTTAGGTGTNEFNLLFQAVTTTQQPIFTAGSRFNMVDFSQSTGISGTGSVNIGSCVLNSGGTYTSWNPTTIRTGTINTNGRTILGLTINCPSGTTSLLSALTVQLANTTTLTEGTLDLAGFTLTTPAVTSSSSSARSITGAGTIAVAGNWTISDGTNFTAGTYTINMTSASSKTFGGGGGSYGNLVQAGAGAITISGSNQFNNITATTRPSTITVTAGTTQTLLDFTLSGILGSLVTINSTSAGTQFNLRRTSGTSNVNYLSIQDSNASAAFFANNTSVNSGNNIGWNFTFPAVVQSGFASFF